MCEQKNNQRQLDDFITAIYEGDTDYVKANIAKIKDINAIGLRV